MTSQEIANKQRELQYQLEKIKEEEKKALVKEKGDKNRSLIGKFFKCASKSKAHNSIIGSNRLVYLHILDFIRYSDGRIMYGEDYGSLMSESFDIQLSPSGFKLLKTSDESKFRLAYLTADNKFSIDLQKMYGKNTAEMKYGSSLIFSQISIESVYPVKEDGKAQFYDGYRSFTEITEEEYYDAYNTGIAAGEVFYNSMKKFANKAYTPESEGLLPNFTTADVSKLNDLFTFMKANPKISLDIMVSQLAGKVARYQYFVNDKLPELAQYQLCGRNGLNLDIQGRDDGTDYEPYTTHFVVCKVEIDWFHILYPIRTKLVCKVSEMVKKLESFEQLYYTSSWKCNYDSSGYDAQFHSAKLDKVYLDLVNRMIGENLK